ncbi:hypothetical protein [Sphingomonas beigongshangi]|uniref:hypothetical protein n=1 Tax=Sphingomonas beigongshangi TaxID=2782540 RepID=UPI001AEE97BE|nr:hypothetical protein [Sphingomonas beigongshangi]
MAIVAPLRLDDGIPGDAVVKRPARPDGFVLTYGALERTIAGLNGADPDAIRSRFRKLRLRPFPPDIRTGTGVRVQYDLARSLALTTAFELNVLLPQGGAVAIVEHAWPEICRAAICAAADLGVIRRPAAAPSAANAVVTFMPDGFASGAPAQVVAARVGDDGDQPVAGIRMDLRRHVVALTAAGEVKDAGAAFSDLDSNFGWSPTKDPGPRVRSDGTFLEDGPFFMRAEALLEVSKSVGEARDSPAHIRAQALVDYLSHPAPVDAWKMSIGRRSDRPRLGHLLQAFAAMRGFAARAYDIIEAVTGPDKIAEQATDLIRRANPKRR